MRGQASFEFLIVALVFFAVLALWLGGVVEANSTANRAISMMSAKIAADRIAAAADQVYFMGDGNEISIELNVIEEASVKASSNKITVSLPEKDYVRNTAAKVSGAFKLEGKSKITAICTGNKVLLKSP